MQRLQGVIQRTYLGGKIIYDQLDGKSGFEIGAVPSGNVLSSSTTAKKVMK